MELVRNIDGNSIISEISSGGHAIVYKAWDPVLEKHFAIKLMREDAAENADRFLTEAKVLAQLEHPNIPRIYSYGLYQKLPFLRMDFINGENLSDIIFDKGKLPESIALLIILQVAKALEYTHNVAYEIYGEKRRGIIHRDIKPGNILVDKNGVVKLIDFGIVKVDKLTKHTSECSIVGTFHYMPPEQLDPRDEDPLDHRADIYGLGCVLYECVTGCCQFDASTKSLLLGIKEKGEYDLTILKSQSKTLQKIISKATASDKEKRYKNIREMIEDLEKTTPKVSTEKAEEYIRSFLISGEVSKQSSKKSKMLVASILLALLCIVATGSIVAVLKKQQKQRVDNLVAAKNTHSGLSSQRKEEASIGSAGPMAGHLLGITTRDTIGKQVIGVVASGKKQNNTGNVLGKVKHSSDESSEYSRGVQKGHLELSLFEMFKEGKFIEIVNRLSKSAIEDLNDTDFLVYCGALLATDINKMGEVVFGRSVNDGYVEYLRGRHFMNRNKWDIANERLLNSMTIRSVFSFKEQVNYALAVSSYNLYLDCPTIVNREFFTAQHKEYINKYCGNGTATDHCNSIKELQLVANSH